MPTNLLPALSWYHGDLKLLFGDSRTFCVCRGGQLAPYAIDGVCYTEGTNNPQKISECTNIGIITRLKASSQNEEILNNIRQRALQQRGGNLVRQELSSYLDNNPGVSMKINSNTSGLSFCEWGNVDECFPPSVSAIVKQSVLYFAERLIPQERWKDVAVFAPEVDYAGISFSVNPDFAISPGIFIVGECTGKFRGIAQAFCSGMICAENILRKTQNDQNRKE